MTSLLQSLFVMLATATRQELARQVQYLKAENEVLRGRLGKRIDFEPRERNRLVRLGRKLGSKVIHELVRIVAPKTFLRWLREEKKPAVPDSGFPIERGSSHCCAPSIGYIPSFSCEPCCASSGWLTPDIMRGSEKKRAVSATFEPSTTA